MCNRCLQVGRNQFAVFDLPGLVWVLGMLIILVGGSIAVIARKKPALGNRPRLCDLSHGPGDLFRLRLRPLMTCRNPQRLARSMRLARLAWGGSPSSRTEASR